MKSKPYVLSLALAVAALVLWFIWHPAKGPLVGPATPTSAPSSAARGSEDAPAVRSQTPSVDAAAKPGVASSPASVAAPVGLAGNRPSAGPGLLPGNGAGNPDPAQAAQIDVGRVRHMISDYHTLMGENPVGTNAEIMKQMMGGNSHQATLGPPDGMALNAQGELVDQWGTPFFFHQLSRDKMEVRSAGPDKVMWTADDIVSR